MDYSVFCIALESRKKNAKKFVQSMGYHECIFPQIVLRDSLDYKNLIDKGIITSWFGIPYPSSKGYMGKVACSLSHAKVLKQFLQSGKEVALVFEDDNRIPKDPKKTRKKVEELLQDKSWDFMNLSPCFCECVFSNSTSEGIFKASGQCTSAYLVRREGAKSFLKLMFPLKPIIKIALDTIIPYIPNSYETRPRLFEQNEETQSTNGNHFESRMCIVTKTQALYGLIVFVVVIASIVIIFSYRGNKK